MAGLDGIGASFLASDMASAPTFTEIANVTSISGPSISRETYDVTAHDSTGGYREFIGGLREGGEVSFDLNFDPEAPTHQTLIGYLGDAVARDYQVTLPNDAATFDFSGFLTGWDVSLPIDDKITAAVTFKVTSKPTLTVGSTIVY